MAYFELMSMHFAMQAHGSLAGLGLYSVAALMILLPCAQIIFSLILAVLAASAKKLLIGKIAPGTHE